MNNLHTFINLNKLKYIKNVSILSRFLDSSIGKNSFVYYFSRVTGSKISNYTYISPLCIINNCEIGSYCSIARNVKIGLGNHPTNFTSTSPIFYSPKNPLKIKITDVPKFDEYKRTFIGNDVWIGINAFLVDGISVGDGAIIGANAVVTKDIPPFSIAVGCPAQVIKYRFSEENRQKILASQWWEKDILELKSYINLFQMEVTNDIIDKLVDCS
jgi:acetyltransferase-like isoleucine patch superfamily enzyme